MTKVSAYIIAYNEADKIADAVKSIAWADEVLVLDSHSTDDTARIAAKNGAEVRQLTFNGFGKLRNDAIASCKHDWVFSLDADERCTPEAETEIRAELKTPKADAYYVPRRNWFMGRWIKHCGWYPDYRQPQLFRKDALRFDESDEVHESFETTGKIDYLKSDIVQIPFQSLEQMIDKMQRYSTLGASKLVRKGKPATLGRAFAHGTWAFIRIYILKLGFLDGWAGFMIALANFEGTFYRYAKAALNPGRSMYPPAG